MKVSRIELLILVVLLFSVLAIVNSCGTGNLRELPDNEDVLKPRENTATKIEQPDLSKPVNLWSTYYFIPTIKEVSGGIPFRDKNGKPLGYGVSLKDWCSAAMEGTAFVNGVTINYWGTTRNAYGVNCKSFYRKHTAIKYSKFYVTPYKYGVGNKSNPLTPFVSIACDQRRFKFKQRFFIPDAVGTKLPNGKEHDGFFICEDVGGAIKGSHIDTFLGPYSKNPFNHVKSSHSLTFKAYIQ